MWRRGSRRGTATRTRSRRDDESETPEIDVVSQPPPTDNVVVDDDNENHHRHRHDVQRDTHAEADSDSPPRSRCTGGSDGASDLLLEERPEWVVTRAVAASSPEIHELLLHPLEPGRRIDYRALHTSLTLSHPAIHTRTCDVRRLIPSASASEFRQAVLVIDLQRRGLSPVSLHFPPSAASATVNFFDFSSIFKLRPSGQRID